MKLDNKGFTLVEVLAVVVIIALVGSLTIPGVLKTIESSKESAYNIMVSNIKTASIQMFQEIESGITIYKYSDTGSKQSDKVEITSNGITINLQTLVNNGYLPVTDNKLINQKTNENIGSCEIKITKEVTNEVVTYKVANNSTGNADCPTNDEYGG